MKGHLGNTHVVDGFALVEAFLKHLAFLCCHPPPPTHTQGGGGNAAFSAGAAVLRRAGHERHPDRPAFGLHPPPHLPACHLQSVRGKNALVCHLGRRGHRGLMQVHLHSFSSAFSFRLLPWEANVVTYRFMGSDKCMYPFIDGMSSQASRQRPVQVA